MNLLDVTLDLFSNLVNGEVSFVDLMNKKINNANLSESDKTKVKDSIKSIVNRYYHLRWELKPIFNSNYTRKEIDLLIISLSYARYVKNVTFKDTIRFLEESIIENGYHIDYVQAVKRIDSIYQTPLSYDYSIEKNVVKKISLMYSYPEWIVKNWIKEYGVKKAYKTIAFSRDKSPLQVAVNVIENSPDFLSNNKDFIKDAFASTSYSYVGSRKLIDNPFFQSGEVFVLDQSLQYLIDNLDLFQGDKILFYGVANSSLPIAIAQRIFDFGKVYFANDDYSSIAKVNKKIESNKLNSIIPIRSSLDLLITHLEKESMDKVVCFAPSSNLGLIRRRPELLLIQNKNDKIKLKSMQKEYIENIASYCSQGGTFIYAVTTLGQNETTDIVEEFLANHSEFQLVKEEMIFPFVHKCDGLYFAKMVKGSEKND